MRLLLLITVSLCLSACVSSGKFKRTSQAYVQRIDTLNSQIDLQDNKIDRLNLMLERSRGANDALILTQDKLQDRLAQQEDELDDVQGNLTNTSSRLAGELKAARAEAAAIQASRDSLLAQQQALVEEFEAGLTKASVVMDKALMDAVPTEKYRINITGGEVRLSVQEDLLFQPKSVNKLADEAEIILRSVMDALQADPLLKLEVIGHTDNKPNPRRNTSNLEYASLRANYLAQELAETYYLSPNRVVAASQGEFGPLTSNATDEGRATNRRVDFVLRNSVSNLLRQLGKLE
ncbi:OmpA family protein [Lewinella sp. 4G2]|uniref:OmpA family protein n=1 Tax=Lewinella sp. 4G2 TaxID=1803372 RepID=UPI0007B4889E|nr:OmpA family protein [Lewinella sp. 4G2]OAV43302.1 hypothetical protein A3850_001785 [Lewinella sp. 4G2]